MNTFDFFGIPPWLFILLVVWTVIWKGLALWRAAHRQSKPWFVFFLVINTMGIVEIIYLYFISKDSSSNENSGKLPGYES